MSECLTCLVVFLLKSVCVHFAPGSNRQSFPLEYTQKFHLKRIVATLSMLQIAGETLKEACAAHAVPVQFMCYCYPPIKKETAAISSFLQYFFIVPQTGLALELRLEGMSILLYLDCQTFCSVCGDSNVLESYRFLLENLKVILLFLLTQLT